MGVKHTFQSAKSDGGDATVVRPTNWNEDHTIDSFALASDISPTQLSANQNDYNPTSLSTAAVLRLSSDATRDITGLQGGADGRILVLLNVGSNPIVLKDESASSTAANRFALPLGDHMLQPDEGLMVWYDSTSSRWRVQGMARSVGYALDFGAAVLSPADATTYYYGSITSVAPQTTADVQRIYVPRAGIVKSIYGFIQNGGTLGSSETSTISFRLNNTTDTTISSAVVTNAVSNVFSNAGLSIPVALGDYFEVKWVTPTWATNPTTLRFAGQVYIE